MREGNRGRNYYDGASHWSDEELLDYLYGIEPEDKAKLSHLAQCTECLRRAEEWHATRSQVTAAPDIQESFLAAQRAAVYRRLERNRGARWFMPLAPAAATMALMLLAIFLHQPAPAPPTKEVAITDSQFFSEVYEDVYGSEPKGLDTIHGLFEETQ
jgi:anti-sigma factor RsiW